jgi:glucose-6-phosphate-specific signal transduction histidine kinase
VKLVPESNDETFSRCLSLSVHDSGIGVSDSIEDLAREGSGIATVQSIVTKLGGSLHLSSDNGTLVLIRIPDSS